MQCGNKIESDCQAEYNNAKNNKNLDPFYGRCEREGAFRSRCSLCCNKQNSGEKDMVVGELH